MMSLNEFVKSRKITMDVKPGTNKPTPEDFKDSNAWTVTLKMGRKRYTLAFFTGRLAGMPTVEDVIECLASDASYANETFEGFCASLGYDTDSRKAEKIYKAVKSQTAKLRRFLGDDFETIFELEF